MLVRRQNKTFYFQKYLYYYIIYNIVEPHVVR